MPKAVLDMDAIKYAAASAGEKRTIRVTHHQLGIDEVFNNRTEFYGGLKKDGGYLAVINKGRTAPISPEEFIIEDIQTPDALENVLWLAKSMTEKWLRAVQADTHIGFLGKGDSWRVERSTILKYKGQRDDMLRPLHLDTVANYLTRHYNVRIVEGLEADDWCVIEAYQDPTAIVLAIDKDAAGCPTNVFNPSKPELGVINCNQLGRIYKDSKGKIRGYGRLFMYHQVCSGDTIDNYKANSASPIKWGPAASFKMLHECKSDKEAFAAMKAVYQKLYPKPRVVTGWRGDEIEVDWQYMLNENFDMARMLRWETDKVVATEVLDKMGLL